MKGPSLPDTAFDVLAIGSAIVDVFAPAHNLASLQELGRHLTA